MNIVSLEKFSEKIMKLADLIFEDRDKKCVGDNTKPEAKIYISAQDNDIHYVSLELAGYVRTEKLKEIVSGIDQRHFDGLTFKVNLQK